MLKLSSPCSSLSSKLLTLRILSKVAFDFVMYWSFASWIHCSCWPSAVAGIPDVDGVP
jgi:hypothetical protein